MFETIVGTAMIASALGFLFGFCAKKDAPAARQHQQEQTKKFTYYTLPKDDGDCNA